MEEVHSFDIDDSWGRRRVHAALPRQATGRAATVTARSILGVSRRAHIKLSAATGQRQQWTRRR